MNRQTLLAAIVAAGGVAAYTSATPVAIGGAAAAVLSATAYLAFRTFPQILARQAAVEAAEAKAKSVAQSQAAPPMDYLKSRLADIFSEEEAVDRLIEELDLKATQPATGTATKENVNIYQRDAIEINRILDRTYGVPASINWKRRRAISLTPLHVLYELDTEDNFALTGLVNRLDDLARALHGATRKKGTDPIRISVIPDTQPLLLQVSRPDPQPHSWADRAWKRRPMNACLGDYWDGPTRTPLLLDLFGKETTLANGLFCGQPRSGKSRCVHAGLLGLMESTRPTELHVYAIETKTNAYSMYNGLPHFKQAIGDMEGVLPMLRQFAAWATPAGKPTDGAHRHLIFDEFQDVMRDPQIGAEAAALMAQIMAKGSEMGLRVWLVTHVPDRESYPSNLKPLTHFKIAFRIENDNYMVQQMAVVGARTLTAKKEFIFVGDGINRVATAFNLDDETLSTEIDLLHEKWGSSRKKVGITTGDRVGIKRRSTGDRSGARVGITTGDRGSTRVGDIDPVNFPIPTRDLTDAEAGEVYRLYTEESLGTNQLQNIVFGGKSGPRGKLIVAALERARSLDG